VGEGKSTLAIDTPYKMWDGGRVKGGALRVDLTGESVSFRRAACEYTRRPDSITHDIAMLLQASSLVRLSSSPSVRYWRPSGNIHRCGAIGWMRPQILTS
jgi:hypothetical protein